MSNWVKNKDNKFDIDLRIGEGYEESLAHILTLEKVEVKTEIDTWKSTGNIAIEIRCRGKLSGITVTEATYWAHILSYKGYIKSVILIPVDILKSVIKDMVKKNKAKIVMGGDDNASELVLVPLKKIWKMF